MNHGISFSTRHLLRGGALSCLDTLLYPYFRSKIGQDVLTEDIAPLLAAVALHVNLDKTAELRRETFTA